jgi:hypothetical protein
MSAALCSAVWYEAKLLEITPINSKNTKNTKNTKISPTMAEAPVATSISAAPDTVNLPIYLNKEVPLALHCRPFI